MALNDTCDVLYEDKVNIKGPDGYAQSNFIVSRNPSGTMWARQEDRPYRLLGDGQKIKKLDVAVALATVYTNNMETRTSVDEITRRNSSLITRIYDAIIKPKQ
ncbi:hypothetical protein HQ489_04995 [Candidatus Woesearchaeota archaeon]|nr:hypothetical protein [Candidatus Woesearchaeota archaeon]